MSIHIIQISDNIGFYVFHIMQNLSWHPGLVETIKVSTVDYDLVLLRPRENLFLHGEKTHPKFPNPKAGSNDVDLSEQEVEVICCPGR